MNPRSIRPAAAGLLLFLGALNLRPSVTTVGPLLPQLGADLQLTESVQGVLTALPLLSFGIVSPLVPRFTRRVGHEQSVIVAMALIALGAVVRSFGGALGLWAGTVLIGIGTCIGNVVMPVLARQDHPRHIPLATGVYSTCVTLGAAASFALAVPMATRVGWRGSMAVWAVPAVLVALSWVIRRERRSPGRISVDEPAPMNLWTSPRAWLLTVYFGLQSAVFYSASGWWVTLEKSMGVSEQVASGHLVVFQLCGGLSGLLIPLIMRGRSLVPAAVVVSGALVVGISGVIWAPAHMAIWAAIIGSGTGATFVVALTMISLAGRSSAETTRLSGMAQSVGYLIAAIGPWLLGHLADLTGAWSAPMLVLLSAAIVHLCLGVVAGRTTRS